MRQGLLRIQEGGGNSHQHHHEWAAPAPAKEAEELLVQGLWWPPSVKDMNKEQALLDTIKEQDKYIDLLIEELNETSGWAWTHGWKSTRSEAGAGARARILEAKIRAGLEQHWKNKSNEAT